MVFVKVTVFCCFFTKKHHKTIIFPTYGFGMILINFSSVESHRFQPGKSGEGRKLLFGKGVKVSGKPKSLDL